MNACDWRLGASSCSFGSVEPEVFRAYAEQQIQCMEISLGHEAVEEIDWKRTLALSREYGVELWSFHLPFTPFSTVNPASPDREIRQATLRRMTELLARSSDAGIRLAVVHPSAEPNPAEERSERLKYAADSLAALAEAADRLGITVAVEDLPRTCIGHNSDELREILAADSRLRVCFDTNHLTCEDNLHFIRALGDRIVTVHISDYDLIDEKHWMPYEGKNDWVGIVTELENAGYAGPFMYEVSLGTPRALTRARELRLSDFRPNYLACVHKRRADPIV